MAKHHDVLVRLVSQDGKCPNGHRTGDEFRVGRHTPGGLCVGAFASLLPYITTLKFGGNFPWEQTEGEGTFACPDHLVRNVFHLRRVARHDDHED